MIMMMSFSYQKLTCDVGVNGTPPYPRSVPRVGMLPPPPCERKHSVTPKVSSVTPSTVSTCY